MAEKVAGISANGTGRVKTVTVALSVWHTPSCRETTPRGATIGRRDFEHDRSPHLNLLLELVINPRLLTGGIEVTVVVSPVERHVEIFDFTFH